MAFDFKKEYKEFYMPKNKPSIVEIPRMNYIAVRGTGNPNEENGDYQNTIGLLYGIAYTIKMSYKGTHKIDGFFEYVVPPLEGFWWQDGIKGTIDYNRIRWLSTTWTRPLNSLAKPAAVSQLPERPLDMGMCTTSSWVFKISSQRSIRSAGEGWVVLISALARIFS